MELLSVLRRWHHREHLPIRVIAGMPLPGLLDRTAVAQVPGGWRGLLTLLNKQ